MPRARDGSSRSRPRRPSIYRQLKGIEALADGATLTRAAGLAGTDRATLRRLVASDPVLLLEVRLGKSIQAGTTEVEGEIAVEAARLAATPRAVRRPTVVQIVLNNILHQVAKAPAASTRSAKNARTSAVTDPLADLTEEERTEFDSLAVP